MRIITGDETGLIKQILIENKRIQRWGTQSRDNSIERMAWAGETGSEENEVAVAMANGKVQIWDIDRTEIVKEFSGIEGIPRGLGISRNNDVRKVISCTEDGKVDIFDWNEDGVVDTFDVRGPVSNMRLCPSNNNIFAVGGRENDLILYDLEKQEPVFKARNVPNDFLQLRVPIWVSDMQFLHKEGPGFELAVVTGYHHIRLYDTRAKRQPVQSVEIGERPFTCCCLSHNEKSLFAGDSIGRISQVDLRMMRLNGAYKGNTGSVRELALHPSLDILVSVGLDRVMRVFDVKSRKQLHRVYLRQRLNCVLVSSEEEVGAFAKDEEEKEEVPDADDLDLLDGDDELVAVSGEE